ncbi:MAG: hypothetical protein WB697_12415 [Stellaceae bacterium]
MIAADSKIEIGAPSSLGTWSTGTDIQWLGFILQESGADWSTRLICRDDFVIEAAFLDQDGRLLPLGVGSSPGRASHILVAGGDGRGRRAAPGLMAGRQ